MKVFKLLPVLILAALSLGFAKISAPTQGIECVYPVPLDTELQSHVIRVCRTYQIDPAIVFAIISCESSFDPNAMGDNGQSYGLMQVKASNHRERISKLGVNDLLDPYQNVLVGIDYLAELIDEYDNLSMALVAYNAGCTGAYNGWFSVGRYESSYSKTVLHKAQLLWEGVST